MQPQSIVVVALIPLIAWRLYSRVRRLVGRQRSVLWRHVVTAVLFPVLIVLLGLGAWHGEPAAAGALAGGVAVGIGLAVYGLRLTRFEVTDEGWFYTPSAHIGIALSVLVFGRVAYRLVQIDAGRAAWQAAPALGASPLTLLVFGMLAGYYAVYAIGLLRWRRRSARPPGSA